VRLGSSSSSVVPSSRSAWEEVFATTAIARRLLSHAFHVLKEVENKIAADGCAR
jgi:hypothetical protein